MLKPTEIVRRVRNYLAGRKQEQQEEQQQEQQQQQRNSSVLLSSSLKDDSSNDSAVLALSLLAECCIQDPIADYSDFVATFSPG